MFIQHRKIVVKDGYADKIVERFSKPGIVEQQEGFIDLTVMTNKMKRTEENVIVLIRWESEEHWKQWERSDAHREGHRKKHGQPKPDYILDTEVSRYTVKAVKEARAPEEVNA